VRKKPKSGISIAVGKGWRAWVPGVGQILFDQDQILSLEDLQALGQPRLPSIAIAAVIIPDRPTDEGILIRSTSAVWLEIVSLLKHDWSMAYQLSPEKWEEITAGAYSRYGYDVVITPRSGDFGRDVIATSKGVGAVRILGSVKAYKPGHLVEYDHIRALLGLVYADPKASKGIISTTSDFPSRILRDKYIAPALPYKLELMNKEKLQAWLFGLLLQN
jgi:restriction system protein